MAVILTEDQSRSRWEGLVECSAPIESRLHQNLLEHLNSEIVLKTIDSLQVAKEWLRGTYLYVRLQSAPTHYDIGLGSDLTADELLDSLLAQQIDTLSEDGILHKNGTDEAQTGEQSSELAATSAGMIMSRYCMSLSTFRIFAQMQHGCDLRAMLMLVAQASENDSVRFRAAEKGVNRNLCILN